MNGIVCAFVFLCVCLGATNLFLFPADHEKLWQQKLREYSRMSLKEIGFLEVYVLLSGFIVNTF